MSVHDQYDDHQNDNLEAQARQEVAEAYARRRWESYWHRSMPTDGYAIAAATAAVDNLDRRVPSPFDITFAEARAYAAIHGCRCDCHPAPETPDPQRRSGAA